MKDILKQHIETGKPINELAKEEIKANNKQWFLIIALLATIWIGYICVINKRIQNKYTNHNNCDSIHKIDKLTIQVLKQANDSAVYFYELKNR